MRMNKIWRNYLKMLRDYGNDGNDGNDGFSKRSLKQGITNRLTLPIEKMLYIYLLCP